MIQQFKTTVMKKVLLLRLVAITFFCLASLAIKSETSICNMKSICPLKSRALSESLMNTEQEIIHANQYDVFL